MMTREQRLKAWFNGELEDDELNDADIAELNTRVFDAIAKKTLVRQGVHTFPQHRTVQ